MFRFFSFPLLIFVHPQACLSGFAQPCKLEKIPFLPALLKGFFFSGRCHRSTKYFVCLHLRNIGLEKSL